LGIINASVAWSDAEGRRDGIGGSANYLYLGRNLSFNLLLRSFTRDYSNISLETTQDRIKYEASAGASYFSSILGSLSLGIAATKKYIGSDTKTILASYSRKITDRSNIMATFKRDMESNVSEFMIGLNYYFKYGISASSSYQRADKTSSERIQVIKNLPLGEGIGGRAAFEANQAEPKNFNNYNLQLQYNAKYGQFGSEFISTNRVETYSLTAAGGITFVKDSFNFTRPVQDSFAVVKVEDLKGVRVYLNNQEIGRTSKSGKVLIPNLGSYYDNQISISDKDIPIEYQISEVLRYVSPPLRSGSYVKFGATKIQSFIGTLKIKLGQEVKPLEYIEFKLMVEGKELLFPTGKGGEFYFENVRPGEYRGELKYLDKNYSFNIIIPKSDDVIVDLGEIICE
jgi:outer membrane usher protein FimD/PapC